MTLSDDEDFADAGSGFGADDEEQGWTQRVSCDATGGATALVSDHLA